MIVILDGHVEKAQDRFNTSKFATTQLLTAAGSSTFFPQLVSSSELSRVIY